MYHFIDRSCFPSKPISWPETDFLLIFWDCITDFTICYLFSAQCVLKCIAVFFKYLAAKSKPSKCRRLYFYFARVVFWMYQKTCLFYIFLCTKWLWLPLCTNSPMHEKLFSVSYYTVSGHKHSGPFSASIRFIFKCIFVFPRPGRWWPEGEDPKTSISWPARCVSGTNRWVVCVCVRCSEAWKKRQVDLYRLHVRLKISKFWINNN